MLFNTVSYLVFLLGAGGAFWLLPRRWCTWVVLAASILFYAMWRIEYVLLISFSAAVDYNFSLRIYDELNKARRKLWLICSLSTNLGLLLYFKYTHFILNDITTIGGLLGYSWVPPLGKIVLPLGISFYTFLSISYTLDVYRGLFAPVRNFGTYLTYVMFWPHMIAGPILRAHELIPQIAHSHSFQSDRFSSGIRKIVFGLFLKVALADQIAPYVDDAFLTSPNLLSALDIWTMAFAFGLQIYFDFGGYSMIAIGSARLLGIEFPENFRWPYLASSPRDFWQRWHITLSSWIRDYLYLPLCGVPFQDRSGGGLEINIVRPSSLRSTFALFMSWFLMGLWHGAAWKFAAWGTWHATFIWLYRLCSPLVYSWPKIIRKSLGWVLTLAITMLAWILFRAPTLAYSFQLYAKILDYREYRTLTFREDFYLIVAVVFVGMIWARVVSKFRGRSRFAAAEQVFDVGSVAFAMFAVFIFLRPVGQFIYFQF